MLLRLERLQYTSSQAQDRAYQRTSCRYAVINLRLHSHKAHK